MHMFFMYMLLCKMERDDLMPDITLACIQELSRIVLSISLSSAHAVGTTCIVWCISFVVDMLHVCTCMCICMCISISRQNSCTAVCGGGGGSVVTDVCQLFGFWHSHMLTL